MIANDGLSGSAFGKQSGTLLLAHRRKLCRISHQQKAASHTRIDKLHQIVQQTPVGEEQSPALFADALKGYGLEVQEVDLTKVVRQEQQSVGAGA